MVGIQRELTETEKQIIAYQEMGKPKEIRNLIALSSKPLIIWALKSTGYSSDIRRDFEEMEQEAFILLLETIDKYDYTKGSFSNLFRLKVLSLYRYNQAYNTDTSLNSIIGDGESEETELMDFIEDENAQESFENVEEKDEARNIRLEVKRTLGEEVAALIFAKYGIGQEEKTFEELSNKYGVSKLYVSDQVSKARRKLRGNRALKNIWESYQNIRLMNTGSIIEFGGSKTNKTNSIVESAAIKRLEYLDKINEIKEALSSETIEEINEQFETIIKGFDGRKNFPR